MTVATLVLCAPFAWLLSVPKLRLFCSMLARVHILIRGAKVGALKGHPVFKRLNNDAAALEHDFVASVYEEICYTIREHRKRGWQPQIRLHGREYIDRALAAGRGAVLWITPCSYAELVVKKALFEADIALVNLRSHVHPFSGSRLGKRYLNRIRTSVEDRYLADTVVLHPNREPIALRELQMRLRKNNVVSVFAIGAAASALTVPCLSGKLKLAMGAPALALLSKAPLLPVYTCADSAGGFDVTVGKSLQETIGGAAAPTQESMGEAFAGFTEFWVSKCPLVWRGWLSRSLWTPD